MDPSLQALLDLTESLLRERELPPSLKLVTEAIIALLPGARHSSVRLLDLAGTGLMVGARSGVGVENRPVSLVLGEGLVGWVIEHGERVLVADTTLDARFVPKSDQGFTIGSIILVPMFAPDMVVGALGCTSQEPNAFTDDDAMMLQLIANCAAPAILRARLRHLALTDDTTQALNQRALFPRLEKELLVAGSQKTTVSVLLLDLDHFKLVNDTWGHAAGDLVLSTFADRVRDAIRDRDIFVRRGGEEFVVILPGSDETGAVAVAERIRAAIADTPVLVDADVEVAQTVSIGVATWAGEDARDLERRADRAMYEAKRAGRNRIAIDVVDDAEQDG